MSWVYFFLYILCIFPLRGVLQCGVSRCVFLENTHTYEDSLAWPGTSLSVLAGSEVMVCIFPVRVSRALREIGALRACGASMWYVVGLWVPSRCSLRFKHVWAFAGSACGCKYLEGDCQKIRVVLGKAAGDERFKCRGRRRICC